MIAAGVLHRVTCYKRRFAQGMTCTYDVREEYDERSEGAAWWARTNQEA